MACATRLVSPFDKRVTLFVEVEAEVLGKLVHSRAHSRLDLLTPVPASDLGEEVGVTTTNPADQLGEEPLDLVDRDPVDVPIGGRVDLHHLLLDRHRTALGLVQRPYEALAASQRALSLGGELGPELGERLELAGLGELELQATRDPTHRSALGVAADT